MSAPDLSRLFEQARAADIEAVGGVPLFRAGRRWRGSCPLCGASKGKKAGGAFSVDKEARVFKCFGCDAGGDVIELERLLRGGTPREAAERLAGGALPLPAMPVRSAPAAIASPVSGLAHRIWSEARPAAGTLAETYLASRGLTGPVVERALKRLRFHPAALWGFDDLERPVRAPAMVCPVVTPSGPTGGIHLTFLAHDGSGKAALVPAKKMMGPQRDAEGRFGGVWLDRLPGARVLIVAEGIESALSAAVLCPEPCHVAAALSLNRLQGGWLPDDFGRRSPEAVQADPEAPAFTWPLAGTACERVLIAVDRDMGAIRIKARGPGGKSIQSTLSADSRARICAGLAEQAWRVANPHLSTNAVRAIAPSAGRDFNDELRTRLTGTAASTGAAA